MKKQFNREIDSQPLLCEELRTDCVLVAKRSNVNNYLTIVAVILFAEKKLNGILCWKIIVVILASATDS